MPPPVMFFTARETFEAARELRAGMPGLHGHGFEARAVASGPGLAPGFPGAEADALRARLATAAGPLDYGRVNDQVESGEDDEIARWLLERLAFSEPSALALRSAPDRGAIVKHDGTRLAWRRFRFESAHRLPNVPPGHKCGRMHGHGFDATVYAGIGEATHAARVQGEIARAWRPLQALLHLGCLNDLPGLDNPTSEVLAGWAWSRLEETLGSLCGITVMETASAGCHFDGSDYRIWKAMSFDSAVRLARAPDDDRRRLLHGHTFTTRMHVGGGLDEVLGWVHDYGDLKQRFDPVFRELDHQPLQKHPDLADNDPASIARLIERRMTRELPQLNRIDVEATPGCGAILLRGDDPRGLLVP